MTKSQKIESITLNQDKIEALIKADRNNNITRDLLAFIEGDGRVLFNIKYKKETPKFPNGAEVLALEEGAEFYYYHETSEQVLQTTWNESPWDTLFLRNQEIFLEKDKCESSTKIQNRHLEITQKVYQINAENNWVADWSDEEQHKHYILWNHSRSCSYYGVLGNGNVRSGGEVYYCEKAEDYIKTLSIEDIKAFLLIYK